MLQLSIYNILFLCIFALLSFSQEEIEGEKKYIDYRILESGDTINIIDADSLKQGKWFEDYNLDMRYYYEIGDYIDGERQGKWITYNNSDEIIDVSHYFLGVKNGPTFQYSNSKLLLIGHYKSCLYSQSKDTIWVDDPEDFKEYEVEVKYKPYTLRDSTWYFFNEFTGDTLGRIVYSYGNILDMEDYSKRFDEELHPKIIEGMPHNQEKIIQIHKKPRKLYFPEQ